MMFKKLNPLLFFSGILLMTGLACAALTGSSASEATKPPAAATDSPTQPPEDALTATPPSGEIPPSQPLNDRFYTQDFDEPVTTWSYVLTSGNKNDFKLSVTDGYFVFDEKGKNIWAYALYDEYVYSDVRLDVRVESQGSNDYQVNLICRYDEHEGWWEFNVKNGKYEMRFGKWDDNKKKASYTRIGSGASNYWNNGRAVNDIGVTCFDSGLSISINGHFGKEAKDDRHFLVKGQIGVGVSSFFDPSVLIRYDWIKIGEK